MLGSLFAIALNTFREAVRSKVLYAILFFAIVLILLSLAFGELALHEQDRVIKDLGIVVVTLFGALIAIYTGVSLLDKEIDKKTIYTIITKPIERWQFLLGKYLGVLVTMLVQVGIMSSIFLALLWLRHIPITTTILQALLLIFVEVAVIAAIALLFGAFSTPLLSGMLTASLFMLGNLHDSIRMFADQHTSQAIRTILAMAEMVLPDLTLFNLSREVTHDVAVSWNYVGWAAAHGGFYAAMLLIAATAIFHRRDFV